MRVIALMVLFVAATQGASIATTTLPQQLQLTCIAGASDLGNTSQTIRVECGGDINPGTVAEARFDWSSILLNSTRLEDTMLMVDSIPDTLREGEELISIQGTFAGNADLPLPTCQTKRRLVLQFNKTSSVVFTSPAMSQVAAASLIDPVFDEWDAANNADLAAWEKDTKRCSTASVQALGKPDEATDSLSVPQLSQLLATFNPFLQGDLPPLIQNGGGIVDKEEGDQMKFALGAVPPLNKDRPTGLVVKVMCMSAPAGPPSQGVCSVRLRLTLSMTGGVNQFPVGTPEPLNLTGNLTETSARAGVGARRRLLQAPATCSTLTFSDTLNVLDTTQLNGGQSSNVNTQLCDPTTPAANAATIPAGAPWDATTLNRAVRFSRFASTLHGCLPGQEYAPGQERTWEDVSSWGGAGPTVSPRCSSCFKDGINYGNGLGGSPRGWETEDSISSFSYRDAAVVFTDTTIDAPAPAIVVSFRATVTDLNRLQWLSNLGSCVLRANGNREPVRDSAGNVNAAAGSVCSGWSENVDLLYARLLADIQQRITALSDADGRTPTRIFVTGHSRGAALASYFAARLLLEQAAGNLGTFNGPLGRRSQISLYTFGGPRVGDATFAGFLEERMYERFRMINRYDPVTSGPFESQGYLHFRPAVWFREPTPSTAVSQQFCVLTPAAQLSTSLDACFDSCNAASVCTNTPVSQNDAIAGTRVAANAACDSIIDSTNTGVATQVFGVPLGYANDHGTYMGIDVNNGQCAVDQSVYNAGRTSDRTECASV